MTKTSKQIRLKPIGDPSEASKVELVVAVLALLGGATRGISVDELALGCHRLDPQAFSWPEYGWLPNLDKVRVTLVDVERSKAAETLTEGRHRVKLWRLTDLGRQWTNTNSALLTALRRRLPDADEARSRAPSELVAIALVGALNGSKVAVPRERIVAEAFRLFPSVFGLASYPGWPDSAAVDRAIRENKRLAVNGDEVSVTNAQARDELASLATAMKAGGGGGFGASARKLTKGSADKALARLEGSSIYRRYVKEGPSARIDEGAICDLLSITLEADAGVLEARLNTLRGLIEQVERWDLTDFLDWLRSWFVARKWRLVSEDVHVE